MSKITHVFSIGRRCTTMSLLERYNIRTKSSPFSWMIVDFETVLCVIQDDFRHYFDIDTVSRHSFLYVPFWRMTSVFYTNRHYCPPLTKSCIYDEERVMIWNHHVPLKQKRTFLERIHFFKEKLNLPTTLCVFCSNLMSKEEVGSHIEEICQLIKTYKVSFSIAYIIPTTDLSAECSYDFPHISFFLFRAPGLDVLESDAKHAKGTPLLDADIKDDRIEWDKLFGMLLKKYTF